MDYRSPAAVLIMLVLLCGGDLNTGSGVLKAMSIRERCECLETVDKLTWRQITDFQVTPRSELCNSVQIVTLSPGDRTLGGLLKNLHLGSSDYKLNCL
ncbi:chemokine (C-X-C motif) ligand 18a, duplicate 1 isoform X2 [Scleropages formosus]|uniref:chemokine (C-X-C motif) ligand 18a, duplicate 1 isoform X2 n=1 Tax=Scleropages formosus TaxID=113540 RepID=UPI0008782C81|nr:uncharacterized protein LOC108918077 isoform X2 [Scleropages formosus]